MIIFWVIFENIASKLGKIGFQSIFIPCHWIQQTTGNSFSAVRQSLIIKVDNFFLGIQLIPRHFLAFQKDTKIV